MLKLDGIDNVVVKYTVVYSQYQGLVVYYINLTKSRYS